MDPRQVPPEVRAYAMKLTGDTNDPKEIYRRIEQDFGEHFLYTLDPPHADGDPVIHFLLRSKTGHCEYFASATVLMLTARGIPARLVTGSYGGEVGFFSRSFVVRGSNLHAWVEADLDGTGFAVLDPTPDAGVPPATRRVSWLTRLTSLGREMEFFYDRRILGFDSLDQAMAAETARRALETAASAASSWKRVLRDGPGAASGWALAVVALVAAILLLAGRWRRRPRVSAAARLSLAGDCSGGRRAPRGGGRAGGAGRRRGRGADLLRGRVRRTRAGRQNRPRAQGTGAATEEVGLIRKRSKFKV